MTGTQSATKKAGEAAIGLLRDYGVDVIFGIPGVHTVEFYRGLTTGGIRHVLTRHEQGAGFMADGYARASGRPGVCCVISGPGVTNVMTPMGQAYSDSVPILVLASVIPSSDLGKGRGRLHEMTDQQAAAATVAGFSGTALSPGELPDLMAKAFTLFQSARPRPAYIEVPIDVLARPADDGWTARPAAHAPAPDAAAVAEAAKRLAAARHPVILTGGGAVEAAAPVRRLAEKLGAMVVPTVAGKGVLPEDHPLCLGALLPQEAVQERVTAADVVLALGSELAETDFWQDRFRFGGDLIRIDIDPHELSDEQPASLAILSDAGKAAEAILAQLADGDRPANGVAGAVTALHAKLREAEDPERRLHRRVLEVIRQALPRETIVATDMTQIAYAGNEVFPVYEPRSWLHPVGFGTLGYAVPAAIGAKLGAPERPVAAIVGDYGFLYTAPELAVAVEEELPVVFLLWNNEELGAIRDSMERNGIQPTAIAPRNPDFPALAEAFGMPAQTPRSLAELGDRIAEALTRKGPSFIEIKAGEM